MPSSKQRANGGGRKPNSEPKLQVFKEFQGCNFELSPHDFKLYKNVDQEQSDLAMNFLVVQNNAGITSNKTIETRNNLKHYGGYNQDDVHQSGPCILINNRLFVACTDDSIHYTDDRGSNWHDVTLTGAQNHTWQSFAYVDNKLIATTEENNIWVSTGDPLVGSPEMKSSDGIPDPVTALTVGTQIVGVNVDITTTYDANHPHAITVVYAFVNEFGPTKHSNPTTFYADYPVDEWHAGRYVILQSGSMGNSPPVASAGTRAVEIFYTTGSSSSYLPAGRVDIENDLGGPWRFSWYGYLDATYMWNIMNLMAPEENFTKGAPVSHVTCIDSRMYFWGDKDKPYRLYIGGNSGNLLSVSPGTGGGFVDVEPGTGQEIRVVTKYKTQSGASIVTMLCTSKNSQKEQRFNLVENTISLSNEQSMKSWQAEQVAGAVGCKSFNGAVVCEDGLYSISRYGLALTTMTMEYNAQIRTNYVSDPIKPVFTDFIYDKFKKSILFEIDGILYMALSIDGTTFEDILFCYDIDAKAWWTYKIEVYEPILNLFNFDYDNDREGIGIITETALLMLPTTVDDDPNDSNFAPLFNVTLQTGELSTQLPQQSWFYLSQMEFRFDYFFGTVWVELTGIDQFGRKVTTKKQISHSSTVYNDAEYMRVDLRLQSYQIRITGQARFRLSHFIAKVYTMSAKQGLVWGFNDSQSFRSNGDIHPTFLDYNDIRKAIIP